MDDLLVKEITRRRMFPYNVQNARSKCCCVSRLKFFLGQYSSDVSPHSEFEDCLDSKSWEDALQKEIRRFETNSEIRNESVVTNYNRSREREIRNEKPRKRVNRSKIDCWLSSRYVKPKKVCKRKKEKSLERSIESNVQVVKTPTTHYTNWRRALFDSRYVRPKVDSWLAPKKVSNQVKKTKTFLRTEKTIEEIDLMLKASAKDKGLSKMRQFLKMAKNDLRQSIKNGSWPKLPPALEHGIFYDPPGLLKEYNPRTHYYGPPIRRRRYDEFHDTIKQDNRRMPFSQRIVPLVDPLTDVVEAKFYVKSSKAQKVPNVDFKNQLPKDVIKSYIIKDTAIETYCPDLEPEPEVIVKKWNPQKLDDSEECCNDSELHKRYLEYKLDEFLKNKLANASSTIKRPVSGKRKITLADLISSSRLPYLQKEYGLKYTGPGNLPILKPGIDAMKSFTKPKLVPLIASIKLSEIGDPNKKDIKKSKKSIKHPCSTKTCKIKAYVKLFLKRVKRLQKRLFRVSFFTLLSDLYTSERYMLDEEDTLAELRTEQLFDREAETSLASFDEDSLENIPKQCIKRYTMIIKKEYIRIVIKYARINSCFMYGTKVFLEAKKISGKKLNPKLKLARNLSKTKNKETTKNKTRIKKSFLIYHNQVDLNLKLMKQFSPTIMSPQLC